MYLGIRSEPIGADLSIFVSNRKVSFELAHTNRDGEADVALGSAIDAYAFRDCIIEQIKILASISTDPDDVLAFFNQNGE